jgi:hypothetical protein
MNATLAMPENATGMGESLSFLAFPARRAAKQVSGAADDLFRNIATILDQMLTDVTEKRTAVDFCAARDEYFPRYVQVMLALGSLINAVVPPPVIERLTFESLSEMEADFRDDGLSAFGSEIKDQAMFTVWTLRKINDLAQGISASDKPASHLTSDDKHYAASFASHVLYSRFHLDCLKMSLRTNRALYPEVLESVSEGLRATVNAYAWIRQGAALRSAKSDELAFDTAIDWDDEEEGLLSSSMNDWAQDSNA